MDGYKNNDKYMSTQSVIVKVIKQISLSQLWSFSFKSCEISYVISPKFKFINQTFVMTVFDQMIMLHKLFISISKKRVVYLHQIFPRNNFLANLTNKNLDVGLHSFKQNGFFEFSFILSKKHKNCIFPYSLLWYAGL